MPAKYRPTGVSIPGPGGAGGVQAMGTLADVFRQFTERRVQEQVATKLVKEKQRGVAEAVRGEAAVTAGENRFDRAYNQGAMLVYQSQIGRDIDENLERIRTESLGDPLVFAAKAKGYKKGMVGNLPAELKDTASLYYDKLFTAQHKSIATALRVKTHAANVETIKGNIEQDKTNILKLVRSGNEEAVELSLRKLEATYRQSVPLFGKEAASGLRNFYKELDKEKLKTAVLTSGDPGQALIRLGKKGPMSELFRRFKPDEQRDLLKEIRGDLKAQQEAVSVVVDDEATKLQVLANPGKYSPEDIMRMPGLTTDTKLKAIDRQARYEKSMAGFENKPESKLAKDQIYLAFKIPKGPMAQFISPDKQLAADRAWVTYQEKMLDTPPEKRAEMSSVYAQQVIAERRVIDVRKSMVRTQERIKKLKTEMTTLDPEDYRRGKLETAIQKWEDRLKKQEEQLK